MSIYYCKEPFFITTSTDTWVHFNANGLLTERKRASYLCYFYVTAKFGNCFCFVFFTKYNILAHVQGDTRTRTPRLY